MRFEIKSLVKRMGITSVYVTHDQAEAMVISDRVVVMEKGNIVQIGTSREIYEKPANRFVADFIGAMNFIPGHVVEVVQGTNDVYVHTEFSDKILCKSTGGKEMTPGLKVYASVRPEDVEVFSELPQTGENIFKGKIVHKAYLGNFLFLFVEIKGTMIRVQAPYQLQQEEGQELYVSLNPEKCMVLPE
jgi:iron(III) transport system ATP-binding protein